VTKFKEAPVKNQGKKLWHPLGKDLALLFVFMETFIFGTIFGTSLKGGSTYKLFLVVARHGSISNCLLPITLD